MYIYKITARTQVRSNHIILDRLELLAAPIEKTCDVSTYQRVLPKTVSNAHSSEAKCSLEQKFIDSQIWRKGVATIAIVIGTSFTEPPLPETVVAAIIAHLTIAIILFIAV